MLTFLIYYSKQLYFFTFFSFWIFVNLLSNRMSSNSCYRVFRVFLHGDLTLCVKRLSLSNITSVSYCSLVFLYKQRELLQKNFFLKKNNSGTEIKKNPKCIFVWINNFYYSISLCEEIPQCDISPNDSAKSESFFFIIALCRYQTD